MSLVYLTGKDYWARKWTEANVPLDAPLATLRRIPLIQDICSFLMVDIVEANLSRKFKVYSDVDTRDRNMTSDITLIFQGLFV